MRLGVLIRHRWIAMARETRLLFALARAPTQLYLIQFLNMNPYWRTSQSHRGLFSRKRTFLPSHPEA